MHILHIFFLVEKSSCVLNSRNAYLSDYFTVTHIQGLDASKFEGINVYSNMTFWQKFNSHKNAIERPW
jgi:hypothetical protein